jgi:hypothetical protein
MLWSRLLHSFLEDNSTQVYEFAVEFRLRRSVLRLASERDWPAVELANAPMAYVVRPDRDDWLTFVSTATPAQLVRVVYLLCPSLSED